MYTHDWLRERIDEAERLADGYRRIEDERHLALLRDAATMTAEQQQMAQAASDIAGCHSRHWRRVGAQWESLFDSISP